MARHDKQVTLRLPREVGALADRVHRLAQRHERGVSAAEVLRRALERGLLALESEMTPGSAVGSR